MKKLFAPLVACFVAGCSGQAPSISSGGTAAGDVAVRSAPVVAGRPARVFIFAGLGDACDQLPPPQVTVTTAPTKGDISFVPGQETKIETSVKGTCIGRTAKGTGVYYTARADAKGSDTFSVTAKLGSSETATRTFEVSIAE